MLIPEKPYTFRQLMEDLKAAPGKPDKWKQPAYYWGENTGGVFLAVNTKKPIDLHGVLRWMGSMSGARRAQQATYQVPGETIVRNIVGVQALEEDYINPSGDGCEPASHYLKGHPNCALNEEDAMSQEDIDLECVYPAGTIIIEVY